MRLENSFPNLSSSSFEVTSELSLEYKCIAWAAGDNSRWWWPTGGYWPINDTRTTVDSFLRAFATIGYLPADDDSLEAGYEKVAWYAKANHVTHAAHETKGESRGGSYFAVGPTNSSRVSLPSPFLSKS